MAPPWKFGVWYKRAMIAEFSVPAHKLEHRGVADLLKAIVARYRTADAEAMVGFYVNKRQGEPMRDARAEVRPTFDFERCEVGFWCGDADCCAWAVQEISEGAAESIKRHMNQLGAT